MTNENESDEYEQVKKKQRSLSKVQKGNKSNRIPVDAIAVAWPALFVSSKL
jgi:hypothetical protein